MKFAVLALQGAFVEHVRMLEKIGCETFEVRQHADWLRSKDGVVLPGGESTAMLRLLREENLLEPIRNDILEGLPAMGTCAGMILLSEGRLATMDIEVMRNAYGRQLGSFNAVGDVEDVGNAFPMTFIRAPYVSKVWGGARPLASVDGRVVAVRQNRQLACAFHPELTDDTRWHRYFVEKVCQDL